MSMSCTAKNAWGVILNIRCGYNYLSWNIATPTSQEVCKVFVSISQVTPCLLPYLTEKVTYTQPPTQLDVMEE